MDSQTFIPNNNIKKKYRRKGDIPRSIANSWSLQRQLLIWLIPALTIPLCLGATIGGQILGKNEERKLEEQLSDEVILGLNVFEDGLDKISAVPISLAKDPTIINLLRVSNEEVSRQNLDKLSIPILESRFAENKLLNVDSSINNYLKTTVDNHGFGEIFITQKNGFNVAYSQITSDFVQRDEDWWQQGKTRKKYLDEVDFDYSTQTFSIPLIQSVEDPESGKFLGIIKSTIPISYFESLQEKYLDPIHFATSQKVQIIDTQTGSALNRKDTEETGIIGGDVILKLGKILKENTNADNDEILNLLSKDILLKNIKFKKIENKNPQSVRSISFFYGDREYILAPIPNTGFIISISILKQELLAGGKNLFSSLILMAIILALITSSIVIILTRRISVPLKDLSIKAESLADGNLQVKAYLVGSKETKILANSFNNLVSQIQLLLEEQQNAFNEVEEARQEAENLAREQKNKNERIQTELLELLEDVEGACTGDLTVHSQINDGEIGIVADFFNSIIENLRDIVSRVKESTRTVNNSVEDNQSAIKNLTYKANLQAQQIAKTLDSVGILTNSIQEIAQNSQKAAKVANIASTKAATGGKSMERTANSILELQDTIKETGDKVKRLGEASQQISRVITLIKQIAMQTNLLAINASIEAARAGEEGKGFAVVAEEVGELATQSTEATKEVGEIISNIQTEIEQVVSAMEVGTTQATEGTRLVEKTKASLEEIVAVSYEIDKLVTSISNTTDSQAKTSERVTKLMSMIAKVSKQTSVASEKVSLSLGETVAIAEKLQSSVDTFKVDS